MTDALRQWVADESGLVAIWMHPDAPRPAKPYASLQVSSVQRVGRSYIGPVDADGDAVISHDREAVVSVSIYESTDNPDPRSALERAEDLRDSLEKPSVRGTLAANGWSLRAVELLTDAPQLIDTKWEPRAVFDVRFGTQKQIIDDLGLIETAGITGTVAGRTEDKTLQTEGQ